MQIDDGPGFCKEIHPQNPIDFKAIIHATYFKFEISQFLLSNLQTINPAPEYNLMSTHTANCDYPVIRQRKYTDGINQIGGYYRAG